MEITDLDVPGYVRVARAVDEESGLDALIAVHDTTLGPALGGMRRWVYASVDDAVKDVLRLAEGMTYKSAVARTGLGGGKSVMIAKPKEPKSRELFRAMGRFIETFGGTYITAEDVGTSVDDMVHVRDETRWVTGLPRELGGSGDPSPFTARGTWLGIRCCLQRAFGSPDPKGRTVAVQGLGNVGMGVAKLLAKDGATIVACDPKKDVQMVARRLGATIVGLDEIYDVACDVFSPNALGAVVNDATIPRIRAPIIAGAANNQLAEARHADVLRDRGVLYAPDFVINAGGIINVSIEFAPGGYDEAASMERVELIDDALQAVFDTAEEDGVSTLDAAMRVAKRRLEEARASG